MSCCKAHASYECFLSVPGWPSSGPGWGAGGRDGTRSTPRRPALAGPDMAAAYVKETRSSANIRRAAAAWRARGSTAEDVGERLLGLVLRHGQHQSGGAGYGGAVTCTCPACRRVAAAAGGGSALGGSGWGFTAGHAPTLLSREGSASGRSLGSRNLASALDSSSSWVIKVPRSRDTQPAKHASTALPPPPSVQLERPVLASAVQAFV